ncbi:NAD(P)-binding protein [Lachnospiraceae bacterium 54-11]
MEKVKYLILGAGPAGLTFANMLKRKGEESFLILEKEKEAGGLCRSEEVDGSPLDIGGGHFLDVRRPKVCEFLFDFLPKEEWALFRRDSRICLQSAVVGHPLEANIWQFPLEEQVEYLSSIAKAGCNSGEPVPERFVEWIVWKLGQKIADDYMLPYNQKMFADELDTLGIYWLDKLPDVSFEDTLRSCLARKPFGSQPGHASFYYPKKYGYGEVWKRMAEAVAPKVVYGCEAEEIDCTPSGHGIPSFDGASPFGSTPPKEGVDVCRTKAVKTKNGQSFMADKIITTVPWASFSQITGMPEELFLSIKDLKSSAVEIRYVPENLDTQAHWLYVPDLKIPYHRILVRHNFCQESRGYWLETREERTAMFSPEDENYRYLNSCAYPLNTMGKPEIVEKLLAFGRENQIYGLGRWGEHSHYNSDVVVERAMELAEKMA